MKWVVMVDQIGAKRTEIVGQTVIGEVEADNLTDALDLASTEFSAESSQTLHVQSRISWRYDQEARKVLDTRERRRGR